jgi:hypothetical protein
MDEATEPRLCNGVAPETAAAVAALIRGGLADVQKMDRQLLGAVLVWAQDEHDRDVHSVVLRELILNGLLCGWCASFVLHSRGTMERWRVVHEADCLIWQRYQKRTWGYTAIPSGELCRFDESWPAGTEYARSNAPGAPCGSSVTWRGPYASKAAQEAARAQAVRAGTGRGRRAA